MTRMDLYERVELRCVDCGEVLPSSLQFVAALRCHDCADCYAVDVAELEVRRARRAARFELAVAQGRVLLEANAARVLGAVA